MSCQDTISHDIFITPKAESFYSQITLLCHYYYMYIFHSFQCPESQAWGSNWQSWVCSEGLGISAGAHGVSLRETRADIKTENILSTYTSGVGGHFASAYSLFSDLTHYWLNMKVWHLTETFAINN